MFQSECLKHNQPTEWLVFLSDINELHKTSFCLFVIGNIHNVLNEKDKAKIVWTKALETSNELGDKGNHEIHRTLELLSVGA